MNSNATSIVVLERGSELPRLGDDFSNPIALSESDDRFKSIPRLVLQFLRQLQVGCSDLSVSAAALAIGPTAEGWRAERRLDVARALYEALGLEGGRLVLCAPAAATAGLRRQVFAIADVLVTGPGSGARGLVDVRFG